MTFTPHWSFWYFDPEYMQQKFPMSYFFCVQNPRNLSRWIWGFPYSSSSSYCSANACRSWMIWRALITPCTALWGGIHLLKTFQSFKSFKLFHIKKDTYLAFLHLLVYEKAKKMVFNSFKFQVVIHVRIGKHPAFVVRQTPNPADKSVKPSSCPPQCFSQPGNA